MIQNYKNRFDALQNIQRAIDDLSGIVIKNPSLGSSIIDLKRARNQIIKELYEGMQ